MCITIHDEPTASALASASTPQDVRGPNGTLLGQFIPASLPKVSFPEFGVTDEELERQLNDPNARWHTPEEVMTRLREIDHCSP
ncbi:hypothetical protein FTUN_6901 [Frigoriglobus tundricola]|uniref:Uncharacterized protein n=1 Tax=Frigoriglobus tundricola TaxID=2774151 RepID=A0A6M5YZJ7_9BACT|nr:hypothetical protein FTUN_6901 [Frigoriglobus tundricola]